MSLFESERLVRESTTKALVPVTLAFCPSCGGRLRTDSHGQLSLFHHGGYGATRQSTTLSCQTCPWSLVVDVTEISPR